MGVETQIFIADKNGQYIQASKVMMLVQDVLEGMLLFNTTDGKGTPFLLKKFKTTFLDHCIISRLKLYLKSDQGDIEFNEIQSLKGQLFEERYVTFYYSEEPCERNSNKTPDGLVNAKNFLSLSLGVSGVAVDFFTKLSNELAKALPDYSVWFNSDDINPEYTHIVKDAA